MTETGPTNHQFAVIPHPTGHHAQHSGASILTHYLSAKVIQAKHKNLLPYRAGHLLSKRGRKLYSATSLLRELALMEFMVCHPKGLALYLHAENDFYYSGFIAKYFKWKTLGWFHHTPERLAELIPQANFFRRMDGCLCVGSNQIRYLSSIVNHDRIWFLPHGVDCDFFTPMPKNQYHPRCLFVGQHLRDFGVFGEVLLALRSRFPTLEATAIVASDYLEKLPKVPWLKRKTGISDYELLTEYHSASCLLLPLKDSTACNSILESLACGLPIVTNDVGGVRDYLDESHAFLCPSGDIDAMVESTTRLLRDEDLNEQMQRAARTQSVRFSWPSIANSLRQILKTEFNFE